MVDFPLLTPSGASLMRWGYEYELRYCKFPRHLMRSALFCLLNLFLLFYFFLEVKMEKKVRRLECKYSKWEITVGMFVDGFHWDAHKEHKNPIFSTFTLVKQRLMQEKIYTRWLVVIYNCNRVALSVERLKKARRRGIGKFFFSK